MQSSKTFFIDTFEGFTETVGAHKKNETFVYKNTDELKRNIKNYKINNFKILIENGDKEKLSAEMNKINGIKEILNGIK